jgi:hypothetical protein
MGGIMQISWLKNWLSTLKQHKLVKRFENKTNKIIYRAKQSNDIATFVRYVDDNVILATGTVPKLRKLYNVLLNFLSEAIVLFATVVYFYTLNVYAAVVLTLLLMVLSLGSRYMFLLAQNYKIKKVDEFFKRIHLFLLFTFGLLIDQVVLVVVFCIVLEIISIERMILQIRSVLAEHQVKQKNKSKPKKKTIAKKK